MHSTTPLLLLSLLSSVQAIPTHSTSLARRVDSFDDVIFCPWDNPYEPACVCLNRAGGAYYDAYCSYVDPDWNTKVLPKKNKYRRQVGGLGGVVGELIGGGSLNTLPNDNSDPSDDPSDAGTASLLVPPTPGLSLSHFDPGQATPLNIFPSRFIRTDEPLIAAIDLIDLGNVREGSVNGKVILNRWTPDTRGGYAVGLAGYLTNPIKIDDALTLSAGANWSIRYDFSWLQVNNTRPESNILGPYVNVAVQDSMNRLVTEYYFQENSPYYTAKQMGDYFLEKILLPMDKAVNWEGIEKDSREKQDGSRDRLRVRWASFYNDWVTEQAAKKKKNGGG